MGPSAVTVLKTKKKLAFKTLIAPPGLLRIGNGGRGGGFHVKSLPIITTSNLAPPPVMQQHSGTFTMNDKFDLRLIIRQQLPFFDPFSLVWVCGDITSACAGGG